MVFPEKGRTLCDEGAESGGSPSWEMAELPKEMLMTMAARSYYFRPGLPLVGGSDMDASVNIKDNEKVKTVVSAVILIWLVLVFVLGAAGSFVGVAGALPLPVAAGALIPVLVFLAAYWTIGSFRDFVMSFDLQFAAGLQAWRFAGLGFIALYTYGVLPGMFAWPAGLGDMAIGITAVWVVLALRNRPEFATGWIYRIWNLLGILDLAVAVSTGGLSAYLGIGISETITTFPMAQMPLVLIPAFLVPLFAILHLASLIQSWHLAAVGGRCVWVGSHIQCGPAESASRA